MDKRISVIIILLLTWLCVSADWDPEWTDGSGSGDDSNMTTTALPSTTTRPPGTDTERTTMRLLGADNDTFYEEGTASLLQDSVATYVVLYCAERDEACVQETMSLQMVHIISFNQHTADDDTAVFLPVGNRSFPKENMDRVPNDFYQVKMQQNITVKSDDVVITGTNEVEENLDVQFYVLTTTAGGVPVVIPQSVVENTLLTYQADISTDIGYEFVVIEDSEDNNSAELEPWAISLIVVAGVGLVGGAGYLVFKKQTSNKSKRKSTAYITDDYTTVSMHSDHSENRLLRSQNGRSQKPASHRYDNPTYDTMEEKRDKDEYQNIDLEAATPSTHL